MQVIDRIYLGLVRPAAIQHRAGRALTRPSASRSLASRKNSNSKAPGREKPFSRHRVHLPLQGMAGVGIHWLTVQRILGQKHLAARRVGPMQRHQCARDRPGAHVAVTLIPDQAGFVHIFATDIEPEDRDRHVPPALVDRQKFMAADNLAAANSVGIVQDDVKRLDLRDGRQGRLLPRPGLRPKGRSCRRSCHQLRSDFVKGRDQPVDLFNAGRGADQHHVVERRDQAALVDQAPNGSPFQGPAYGRRNFLCRFSTASAGR